MTDAPTAGRLAVLDEGRRRVAELAAAVAACPAAAFERTGEEMRARQRAVSALRVAFVRQGYLVERFVWPVARRRNAGARPLVADADTLKREVEEGLTKLDWYGDREDARNQETAKVLDAVARWLPAEEGITSQVAVLLGPATAALDARIRAAARLAPTRAHPISPGGPAAAAAVAGPLLGLLDRARDRLAPPPSGS